jgi:hypothetical protein
MQEEIDPAPRTPRDPVERDRSAPTARLALGSPTMEENEP